MGFSINIDTGGTFTDGFFARGTEYKTIKVLTTPHDLTECLINCIKEGAKLFNLLEEEMLRDTDTIRYSTTIGTNAIIQHTGSKLGLVVSQGNEENLYEENSSVDDPLYQLLGKGMISGISGEIDGRGKETKDLIREEVISTVQGLIDQGARGIVISLKNSYFNPSHEQTVRKWIKEEFPRYYLGSPNIFLASEISERPNERLRTKTTVVNAYIHRHMARYLYKAEEDLRQKFYDKPLLLVHNSGGVARVAKSKSLHTYNSGPVAGLVGADVLRHRYGWQNIISTDMGGTSLDIGVIKNGQFNYELEPSIAGLSTNMAMIEIKALGAGGGSIASITKGEVTVGPDSAGSLPGPACFALGGVRPTVTDADLILGFIDSEFFLGGRMRLDRQRAEAAIKESIANPLGISVEEAAALIKKDVDRNIANQLRELVDGSGESWQPEAILAYGGAGPTHCCGYTAGLGVAKIITSPYSPVFSAFGLGNMDINHKYALSKSIDLADDAEVLCGKVNRALESLKQAAYRDMRCEGFAPEVITFYLEVQGTELAKNNEKRYLLSQNILEPEVLALLKGRFSKLYSIILNAEVKIPHQDVVIFAKGSQDATHALAGRRKVYWPDLGRFVDTPVYRREALRPGNVVNGPVVIEALDTTCVVPKDYSFSVDEYANGVIEGVGK